MNSIGKNQNSFNYYTLWSLVIIATLFLTYAFLGLWKHHGNIQVNWQDAFKKVQNLGENCGYVLTDKMPGDSLDRNVTKQYDYKWQTLPYRGTPEAPVVSANQILATKCRFDFSKLDRNGFAILGLGPLFGDVKVFLNNSLRYASKDDSIVELPLLPSDRTDNVELMIFAQKISKRNPGASTLHPFYVTDDRKAYLEARRVFEVWKLEIPLFRFGLSFGIMFFFSLLWFRGKRMPDTGWIVLLAAIVSLESYINYDNNIVMTELRRDIRVFAHLATVLSLFGFVVRFLRIRNRWLQPEKIVLSIFSGYALLYFSISTDNVIKLNLINLPRIYFGGIVLGIAGLSCFIHFLNLLRSQHVDVPLRRMGRILSIGIVVSVASFLYFVNQFAKIDTLSYLNHILLLAFSGFHAIDLVVFQKNLAIEQEKRINEEKKVAVARERNDILKRFLSHSLVAKFTDDKSMMDNLKEVLKPKTTKVAIVQADIRKYSKISGKLSSVELLNLLKQYYQGVVDYAEKYANVKLIGDCLFFFVEEENCDAGETAADVALDVIIKLVNEVVIKNSQRIGEGKEPLNFGIAMTYGEAVVGNLSSDDCIDYTVIGDNVNMVARLEEMTKFEEIKGIIGEVGVLLSEEASQNLKRHQISCRQINLKNLELNVRSFPGIETVRYLEKKELLEMSQVLDAVV